MADYETPPSPGVSSRMKSRRNDSLIFDIEVRAGVRSACGAALSWSGSLGNRHVGVPPPPRPRRPQSHPLGVRFKTSLIYSLQLEDGRASSARSSPGLEPQAKSLAELSSSADSAADPQQSQLAQLSRAAREAQLASQLRGSALDLRGFAERLAQAGQLSLVWLRSAASAAEVAAATAAAAGGGESHQPPSYSLRHCFVVVAMPTAAGGSTLYVVDPMFREQFELAGASSSYTALLQLLPDVFVGTPAQLQPIVSNMTRAAEAHFASRGRPLPPWRTQAALLSVWLPAAAHDIPVVVAGSSTGHSPDTGQQRSSLRQAVQAPATPQKERSMVAYPTSSNAADVAARRLPPAGRA